MKNKKPRNDAETQSQAMVVSTSLNHQDFGA